MKNYKVYIIGGPSSFKSNRYVRPIPSHPTIIHHPQTHPSYKSLPYFPQVYYRGALLQATVKILHIKYSHTQTESISITCGMQHSAVKHINKTLI